MDAAGRLGTGEHQHEMSGEKPEGAGRVERRIGTRGPHRGRELVPRSQRVKVGVNVHVWRGTLEILAVANNLAL